MIMRIALPLPVNVANARLHFRVLAKRRSEYNYAALMCYRLCQRADPEARPDWPYPFDFPVPHSEPAPRELASTLFLVRIMDQDNALARLKWPIDLLVKWGYLGDDSPRRCRMQMPEQAVDRQHQRVEFTITALDSPPSRALA